jgi:hypothetical protein
MLLPEQQIRLHYLRLQAEKIKIDLKGVLGIFGGILQ